MSAFIEIIRNGQVVSDSSTARKINNLLNISKTRQEGLQMLSLLLPECSEGDFVQFCTSWMQSCCKVDESTKNKDFAIRLLDNLFKISSNYQELKKSVSFFITTRYFDFFFKHFLNSQPGWCCTETCLSLYRGACGPFQEELEKHLRNKVESNVRISSTLAGCFALIPCIGGGGNEGLLYRKNWKAQFDRFLTDCHSVLNELYADVEDSQVYETPKSFKKKSGSERDFEFYVTHLYNHSAVLNSMLLNQYPAAKSVPSDQIFELICRGLAVNLKGLSKRQTTTVISLQKVLPEVHRILLSVLKAVIVTCKSQILPYSHLICKLIKQSLEWTAGSEKSFGDVRIAVYETLCNWLSVARNGSCVETISGVVTSNAVSDIETKKGVVCLKESKVQNQIKSRETIRMTDLTANSSLCYAALKALQFLFRFVGVLLKPEEQKFLQEFVVKKVSEVQKSFISALVIPFSVPSCRLELYSLLLDIVHHPCPKWPPPTNFALRLLRNGINDGSPEVSAFCSSGVNILTIIVHPQFDNGGFEPLVMPEDRRRTEMGLQWREEPTKELSEEPTEKPSEEPSEKPTEKPSEELSEKPTEKPSEKPTEKPSEELSEKPTEKTLGEPTEEPSEKPTEKPSEKLIEKPSEEPLLEPMQESTEIIEKGSETRRKESLDKQEEFMDTDEKVLDSEEDSNILSDEDSRNSVTFSKDIPEVNAPPREPLFEKSSPTLSTDEPSPKKQKLKEEAKETEKVSSEKETPEKEKNVTPEPNNEDGQPKTRYFLRSTRKSSEEPEEVVKRTSSPECLKSTPGRSVGKATPMPMGKKRPRTRALSKVETSEETENKIVYEDDEEDLKAAFDDSFVD